MALLTARMLYILIAVFGSCITGAKGAPQSKWPRWSDQKKWDEWLSWERAVQEPPEQQQLRPVISLDFPDPAIFQDQNDWYSFGTNANGRHVQIAKSSDFNQWDVLKKDALPQLPAWADTKNPSVWAPDVIKNDYGRYVLYFSARVARSPSQHCVGAAVGTNIEGPYTPYNVPLVCPDPSGKGENMNPIIRSSGKGGAIDPAGFRDHDGKRYLVYKVDGNSLSPGGPCGNGGNNKVPTPLMLVELEGDGVIPKGDPVVLLDREERDGPLIEAPSLAKLRDGTYSLFYSSNCWNSPYYDVALATSRNVWGPYTKRPQSMMKTGFGNLTAPGGASISSDGLHMVFHANHPSGRAMFTSRLGGLGDELRLLFLPQHYE